jgi:hypothetical protein
MSRTPSSAGPTAPDWSAFLPVHQFFALDYRSLALYRVLIAVMLLLDWADRLPDLHALYSDEGIVPRSVLSGGLNPVSVHILSGSVWWQAVLVGVAMLFALMMLVGWQTPLATLMSFILTISIHGRNPATMHGGDHLIRGLLFWSIFLPLGAKWSVDACGEGRKPEGKSALSLGTFAFIGQLFIMYLFAAMWKWSPEWRNKSTAVLLALQVDILSTRFGKWVREFEWVCEWLTRSSLWLETVGPAVLLLPFHVGLQRLLVIFAFVGFHLGLALTMELSLFPFIACCAWMALLPSSFWDRLETHWRTPELDGTTIVYDPARPRAAWTTDLLNSWLLFGAGKVSPAGEGVPTKVHGPLLPRVQSQGGWAVVSPDGTERTGADAVVHLFRLSPVFSPLAWVLEKVPAVPGAVAALAAGPATAKPLPAGEPAWKPPLGTVGTTVLLLCFAYVLLYNVRNIGTEYGQENPTFQDRPDDQKTGFNRFVENMMPPQFMHFGGITGLEQGWGVFAPRPARSVGWYYALGELKNGDTVQLRLAPGSGFSALPLLERLNNSEMGDVLRKWPKGEKPDVSKPENYQLVVRNGRWRRIVMNLGAIGPYTYVHVGWIRYNVKQWNDTHGPDERLVKLELYYVDIPNETPQVTTILRAAWGARDGLFEGEPDKQLSETPVDRKPFRLPVFWTEEKK